MKYELRELKSTDLPKMIRIVSKLDIDQIADVIKAAGVSNIVKLANAMGKKKEVADPVLEDSLNDNPVDVPNKEELNSQLVMVGMSVAGKMFTTVLTAAADLQQDFNSLLADVAGLSFAEITEMNLGDYSELVMDFFEKPEFLVFFRQALRLFKKAR